MKTTKNNSTIADEFEKKFYKGVRKRATTGMWKDLDIAKVAVKDIDDKKAFIAQALHRQREELLDSFEEIIGEVEKVNESNGRYNAISEIRDKITALRSSEGEV